MVSTPVEIPYLLELQKLSYETFLQEGDENAARKNLGLNGAFRSIFPVHGTAGTADLNFLYYRTEEPEYSIEECRQRVLTYSVPVFVKLQLVLYDKPKSVKKAAQPTVKEIKEEEVFVGDLPKMTDNGTFIINGTERVVVSQLHRAPGVVFSHDKGKTHSSKKLLYNARIIPYRGSWLDLEFDPHDILYARIDRHRKFYITTLLYAMGLDQEEILSTFFDHTIFSLTKNEVKVKFVPEQWKGIRLDFDVEAGDKIVIQKGNIVNASDIATLSKEKVKDITVSKSYLFARISAKTIEDKEGNVIVSANEIIHEGTVDKLMDLGVRQVSVLYTNELTSGAYLSETMRLDSVTNTNEARNEIYRMIRPGEPPTKDSANKLFEQNLFFSGNSRYNLSSVGRMKLNRRLNRKKNTGEVFLSNDDIVDVVKKIVSIKDGHSYVDDIDTLANRRVKAVGELTANACRIGLARIERVVRERLNQAEAENWMPKDLINPKPITGSIMEFFGSSQLSQFMDQVNPLSEITHKRRISALGPGGLTRERAGFEVRDVHPTHYGRLCPIETPEGPNIGLINSLSIYARVNDYGFLETPYRKVINNKVSKEIVYISAIDEGEYHIAQANAKVDPNGKLLDDILPCRYRTENIMVTSEKINLMDVSPKQIVSVAASLIPFLEHDDANRALMGSNMQRQAVPMVRVEKPLVGTGMERKVALDSGTIISVARSGKVETIDASRVVILVNEEELVEGDIGVDIYNLKKYDRSNQDTCINQKPIVKVGDKVTKGDIIADGSSTDLGELALGQNMRVAFMSWNGYNFEDSILVSEKVLREDKFTSIHIEELVCTIRSTKMGDEEITSDIPNLSEQMLSHLDYSGIVHIGAEVKSSDILVGRIAPKGETPSSPEEKLLRAIFGEKASDVKDTSLRVPSGTEGTVIDVEIFTRQGVKKDARALTIEEMELQRFQKDLDDQLRIVEQGVLSKARNLLLGKKDLNSGKLIDDQMLDSLSMKEVFKLRCEDKSADKLIQQMLQQLDTLNQDIEKKQKDKKRKLKRGDQLAPGVLKMVKVHLAVKRTIAPGDKMAGRHGNKGVVSRICPVEDMPYDENGEPVDVILNPLGVPSRMNVGQILEAHLGLAAGHLGKKINKLVRQENNREQVRELLKKIYESDPQQSKYISKLKQGEFDELVENLRDGVPMATPVFEGASEQSIKKMLTLAGLPESGQLTLFDGQTGDPFDRPVTVGYMYMLKLNHLIDDKMHARSTGPYSLVTQQPLGGKAQFGGQRFGEMEVWALEAYGAAYTLKEMLTIKSDDLSGRTQSYKNIVNGQLHIKSGAPESLSVLVKEIHALGLNLEMEYEENIPQD